MRLCYGCLSDNHLARLCPQRIVCKIVSEPDRYNRDFTDCFVDDTTETSQDQLLFMQNAKKIQLKDGHY